MKDSSDGKTLQEVGERFVVREITRSLEASNLLLDGFGHDAAFVDISVADDEILLINTDRSGLNIAYQLGLAGAECVGDLGVSHAVSDIIAAGGNPKTVTIALLLPPETTVGFVRAVMSGAQFAAKLYGAIITGGDTKRNPKFAMVVTAIGTAHRDCRLRRSSAKIGDALVVTGHLGSMLLGTIAYKDSLSISESVQNVLSKALIDQHPPCMLGQAFSHAKIATACIDISDGLSGTLYSMCHSSGLGAIIEEKCIPVKAELTEFAHSLGLRPMQLSLAGGDWEFLYAIPKENLAKAQSIADNMGERISIIGYTNTSGSIAVQTLDGDCRELKLIEHDSFKNKTNGKNHFDYLKEPQECFGKPIVVSEISK